MPFSKGDKNINRKGRPTLASGGAGNKMYGTRKWLNKALISNRKKVEIELGRLQGKEFLDLYIKLMSYVLAPRTQQIIDITKLSSKEVDDIIESIN
tara:strand:- start:184 stop:471 length:288 start_codon:yes stop_codon:yes gene_type:complete